MNFFWDLDRDELVASPQGARLASMTAKSRAEIPIKLTFLRSGLPVSVPSGSSLRFGIKVAPGTPLLARSAELTSVSGSLVGVINTNTTEMVRAMGREASRQMVGEFSGALLDNDPVSPQTVKLTVEAKVLTEDDDAPTSLPGPDEWLDDRAVRYDKAQTLSSGQKTQARSNIGLGDSATRNVGTTAGTVAAGDDARFAFGQIRLSSLGIASDTDLSATATTTGADQTTAIQAILDRALTAPLFLVWDCAVTAAGLRVHPKTHIVALPGCGAKLKDSGNKPLLQNANSKAYQTTAIVDIVKDADITIDGGIWHGNGVNQAHNSTAEGWHVCMRWMNVERLTLRNLIVYAPRTFSFHISNFLNVVIHQCEVDVVNTTEYNRDGIHLNGPGSLVHITDFRAKTNDDAVAINADDIVQQPDGSPSVLAPFAAGGAITDVHVDGLHMRGGKHCVRVLSGTSRADRIFLSNISGQVGSTFLIVDNYSEIPTYLANAGSGNFGTIVVSNCHVQNTFTTSTYKACAIFVSANVEHLEIRNSTFDIAPGSSGPLLLVDKTATTGTAGDVRNLVLSGLRILEQTDRGNTTTATFAIRGSARVRNLNVSDISVIRRNSSLTTNAGCLISNESSVPVDRLDLGRVSAPHFVGATFGSFTVLRNNGPTNILPAVRGDVVPNYLAEAADPNTFQFTSVANTVTDGVFGSWTGSKTAGILSAILKMPASWANSTAMSIGIRLPTYAYNSTSRSGYILQSNGTTVKLSIVSGSTTDLATITTTIAVGIEYRFQLSGSGTTIAGYVQRMTDELWLKSDGTWQSDRIACASVTNATFASGWAWVTLFSQAAGRVLRIRELSHTDL
jgi:hypothetical protein